MRRCARRGEGVSKTALRAWLGGLSVALLSSFHHALLSTLFTMLARDSGFDGRETPRDEKGGEEGVRGSLKPSDRRGEARAVHNELRGVTRGLKLFWAEGAVAGWSLEKIIGSSFLCFSGARDGGLRTVVAALALGSKETPGVSSLACAIGHSVDSASMGSQKTPSSWPLPNSHLRTGYLPALSSLPIL